MKILFRIFFFLFCINGSAQTITVAPYLQDAKPNSIAILWETNTGEEATVEWGETIELGNVTNGISYLSNGELRIHEVELTGLDRFTIYYYRVVTGNAISAIYHFKTPPFATDNEAFRLVAMSDMQQDDAHPNKFNEIVEDGILTYLDNQLGGDLVDNLALILIPGDLVDDGNDFVSWKETFFEPAQNLISHVPMYPVLGNHEYDTPYYYRYFKLPTNGSLGSEEHWWHKDYGNVRFIGMDSNPPFDTEEQLLWLDEVLLNTCDADSIDFVFAQLHHPYKSELWTPGESDFTGEVITRLEQFSTDCNKPSIHFFGHTHGYSRGQSRDHKHLWINVATAVGAIDNWGEFPNFDYDEFSMSQDDYGFVVVEVTADDDPKLVIKRIDRGDQDTIINNALVDSLVIRLNPSFVNPPTPLYPINQEVIPECVVLKASPFSSSNPIALHGQAHWQVSTNENDFSTLIFESWKNYENWYNEIDTQAEDDLTDEQVIGLGQNETYWWRVRYRDREFNWSNWSSPAMFSVGNSAFSGNLLSNPGAENDLSNWVILEGVVEAVTDGECAGITPNSGEKYFAVGGLCDHSEIGRLAQNVDLSSYQDSIDASVLSLNFGGFLSDYSGVDVPSFHAIFLDEDSLEILETPFVSHSNNVWKLYSEWVEIPPLTRSVLLELKGTRFGGTDNDSYFDDFFVKIGPTDIPCSDPSTDFVENNVPKPRHFVVTPNPLINEGAINYPNCTSKTKLIVINNLGAKMDVGASYSKLGIVFRTSALATGIYHFWIREGKIIRGVGKFVVR